MAGTFTPLPVWSLPPNWDSGVTETLEWLTVILASPSGAEQRRKMRISPRRYIEYDLMVQANARVLYDLLLKSQAGGLRFFYVPVWPDIFRLSTALGPDLVYLIANVPAYSEYMAGGLLILYTDEFNFEVCAIDSVNDLGVQLTVAPAALWPAGTRCMPLVMCRVETDPTASKASGDLLTATVRFLSAQANDYPTVPLTWDSYLSAVVLDDQPDEVDNLSHTYQRIMTVLDNKFGLPAMTDTGGAGFDLRQFTWFLNGRQAHAAWRSKMYALAGQLTPLWVPTFFHDLVMASPMAAADTYMSVALCGYTACGGSSLAGRQDIRIELTDGTHMYRRITASGVVGNTEQLAMAPLGRDLGPLDVTRISFMSFCRLSADAVAVKHITDISGITTATALFREASSALPSYGGPRYGYWNAADTHFSTTNNPISLLDLDTVIAPVAPSTDTGGWVRSINSKSSGKWYVEITTSLNGVFVEGVNIGLLKGNANLYTPLPGDGILFGAFGGIGTEGYVIGVAQNWSPFDFPDAMPAGFDFDPFTAYRFAFVGGFGVVGLAIDLDNDRFWITTEVNSGEWNATTGCVPGDASGISLAWREGAPLFLFAQGTILGPTILGNFGQLAFQGPVPAGFSRGWPQ